MHKTKEQLQKYSPFFTHYTELRIQENTNISVSMLNGDVQQNSKATTSGSSARVFKNGVWGFASTPQITDEDIEDIINDATQNAVFMYEKQKNSKQEDKVSKLPKEKADKVNDFSSKKKKASQKELLDFLGSLDEYITSNYKDVTSRTLYLGSLDVRKSLYTSDDSYFFSMVPRTILYINLAMSHKEDGSTIELYDVLGGLGEFPDVFENAKDIFPKIDTLYAHLQDKTEGIYPDAGIKECIIDADVAGILAHEAIGHTTEADLVQGGSIAGEYMNQEVGSSLVNIVDFAHTFNDEICPVPVFVDDEGTPSEDTIIIENGILKNYMHNKESAVTFKAKPTG
ncbi:MAG: TldD/PmbA family protein, partial [Campylobacteraceae bacterium]|nr:TldD/PmbA family protein [Campylobacteraceae bacterium]